MTEAPRIPPSILANVRQRWPDVADAWAAQVPAELLELCQQHRATPRAVLQARYGFVVAADTPLGSVVLRSSPDPHGLDQAAVAVALAGLGISPTVRQTLSTDHGTWMILDRVQPGALLHETDPASINLEALFEPLAAMHGRPAPRPGMPTILDWLRTRLEDDQLSDLRPGTTIAPAAEREPALDLLADLGRDCEPGLCHGDASLGNIISSGTDRWMYVDPRGVAGEGAYDVAVLGIRVSRIYKSSALIPQLASLANVDLDRVLSWTIIANAARV